MERTMSVEDKIRRAEEIYNRRRENKYKEIRTSGTTITNEVVNENVNKKLKKMILQIIVCMLIYLVFHYLTNSNYLFSEDFRKKCQEMLTYDISLSNTYEKIVNEIIILKEKYEEVFSQTNESNTVQTDENINEKNTGETTQSNIQNEQVNSQELIEQDGQGDKENLEAKENEDLSEQNIGGSTDVAAENIDENVKDKETLTEEEQMKKDAEEIKSKISFIKPLSGRITSVFGWRNPTASIVSKYHTGIDISANQGTNIISATNGKVILASSEGAYGKHLKIQIEDVIIIYAHCLSLEVKEGDEINQGQLIAKVGSTGNSTGPHLHFEIRKENRYVNPDLILEF